MSSSAKKMKATSADIIINVTHCYRIIEFISVFAAISDISVCKTCKRKQTFGETGSRGLGFKIAVTCACGTVVINSGPFINNSFEINRRIVFVMRLLGVARKGINIFCGMMDLGCELSVRAYDGIIQQIHASLQKMYNDTCHKAVEEEKQYNEKEEQPLTNLKVSGDGSWKKRGFSSLYGVTTLIGYNTGKVIDLLVKSSYCQICTYYKNDKDNPEYLEHKEDGHCAVNHSGSSGKMEVDAVVEMFLRSEQLHGVRYSNYIGDGDAKTFKAILDIEPYGHEFKIKKNECIGHVEKRMGSRLRNIKKSAKLGGKGKLTDVLIKKLTRYYGLAIRRNSDSVIEMRKAIMATFYHYTSTNEKPQHDGCPPGADSWCKWRVAQALGQEFDHPDPLHEDVQKHIRPIYEDLSRDDLLERCLGGHTQNANESFNAIVWRLAPKHLNCGKKIIEIAAFLAAGMFNEGFSFVLQTMQHLNIVIEKQSKGFADNDDKRRIEQQERRSLDATKEAPTFRQQEKTAQLEQFEEEEGLLYGPGIAD
ncbi:hypothetical protein ALC60_11725 [Trachymyrmex zeteki]|nr:PREDICTED: uncharacterized protein LOC108728293 [Trachymyrmex zeteki]KYQ49219.1 hypothetical protein ALC60_11725 [Trachymyrmex zeteki]